METDAEPKPESEPPTSDGLAFDAEGNKAYLVACLEHWIDKLHGGDLAAPIKMHVWLGLRRKSS